MEMFKFFFGAIFSALDLIGAALRLFWPVTLTLLAGVVVIGFVPWRFL